MLIECSNCQKRLNVPDEKIPKDRPYFNFTCPACKVKNTINLTPSEDSPQNNQAVSGSGGRAVVSTPQTEIAPAAPPVAPPPPPAPISPIVVPNSSPGEIPSDVHMDDDLIEGLKSALVAYDSEEIQEMLKDKLVTMGFRVVLALNVRDAVKQLRFGRFQLMIIQEDYYGATLSSNQLLRAVNSLELSIRHDMFVAVIGPSFTSLDDLTAFSLSLDTVINNSDIEDVERILISGMGHVQKFYATYNEMLQQRGLD